MTYREFWPRYQSLHAHPGNRALHVVGTLVALGLVATAVATGRGWWAAAGVGIGYGLAWIGHVVFEKNQPATFAHPILSLIGDFHMLALVLRGRSRRRL